MCLRYTVHLDGASPSEVVLQRGQALQEARIWAGNRMALSHEADSLLQRLALQQAAMLSRRVSRCSHPSDTCQQALAEELIASTQSTTQHQGSFRPLACDS